MRPLVLVVVLCIAGQVWASQRAVTSNGREVILHDDGTWRYAETEPSSEAAQGDLGGCADWITVDEDTVTGEVMIAGVAPIVVSDDGGKTGFTINLTRSLAVEGGITLIITVAAASPVTVKGDGISIFFTDGTRLQLANDQILNFKAQSTVHFESVFGKESILRQLAEKRIGTMRVWAGDSCVQRDLSPEKAAWFQNVIRCLIEYK